MIIWDKGKDAAFLFIWFFFCFTWTLKLFWGKATSSKNTSCPWATSSMQQKGQYCATFWEQSKSSYMHLLFFIFSKEFIPVGWIITIPYWGRAVWIVPFTCIFEHQKSRDGSLKQCQFSKWQTVPWKEILPFFFQLCQRRKNFGYISHWQALINIFQGTKE